MGKKKKSAKQFAKKFSINKVKGRDHFYVNIPTNATKAQAKKFIKDKLKTYRPDTDVNISITVFRTFRGNRIARTYLSELETDLNDRKSYMEELDTALSDAIDKTFTYKKRGGSL